MILESKEFGALFSYARNKSMFLDHLMEAITEDVRIVNPPSLQQSHPSPGRVDHEFLALHPP